MTRMPGFLRKTLRITGERHSALDTARGRLVMVSVFFVLAYLMVGARVFDLTIIQGRMAAETDRGQSAALPAAEVFRADITDRNGVLLATSLETSSLYADPALVPDPAGLAKDLCAIFPDLVYGDVLQNLQKKARFVWIKRSLTPREQQQVLALGQPALDFKTERRRLYPQGAMAAHIVGYADVDGQGIAGIENSFDALLDRGGESLALTLDIRLQHILRREIAAAMKKFSAVGGAGAIVDIASGEVLAAVSLPDFDPHSPGAAKPAQMFNNLTHGTNEQGSTFKIFSTAAVLELKNLPLGHKFDAREPLRRGGHTISDYHPEKRELTIPEIFMHSSNIGAALMGEMVGTEALTDFYRDLGLMDPLPLEIPEIGKPQLPPKWRDINTLTASFGHGIAVSGLQTLMAASSIVNGGLLLRPTLVLHATGAEQSKNDHEVRIVSPQTAHRMRQLMRLVVTDGTAKGANIAGYNVGGKTGTAEKRFVGRKGYDRSRKMSSFIAFFPMEAPRYGIYVMVDEPKGTKETYGYATGGWVAAPAAGRVITAMGALLGIAPAADDPEKDMAAGLKMYVGYEDGEAPLEAR